MEKADNTKVLVGTGLCFAAGLALLYYSLPHAARLDYNNRQAAVIDTIRGDVSRVLSCRILIKNTDLMIDSQGQVTFSPSFSLEKLTPDCKVID